MFAEVVPVVQAVDHALKHLKQWMKPQRRAADWVTFFGSQNRVVPQPLGVVGIIVPWNFPINLSFMVLVDVFGATPCNIANKLVSSGQTKLITGVNLPMLLRAMSYRHEALDTLVPRAMSGATQGIIPVAPTAPPVQHKTSSHDPVERDHQQ
jgi:delta 1-pyrroline-5-carboxylate dehydrogenase